MVSTYVIDNEKDNSFVSIREIVDLPYTRKVVVVQGAQACFNILLTHVRYNTTTAMTSFNPLKDMGTFMDRRTVTDKGRSFDVLFFQTSSYSDTEINMGSIPSLESLGWVPATSDEIKKSKHLKSASNRGPRIDKPVADEQGASGSQKQQPKDRTEKNKGVGKSTTTPNPEQFDAVVNNMTNLNIKDDTARETDDQKPSSLKANRPEKIDDPSPSAKEIPPVIPKHDVVIPDPTTLLSLFETMSEISDVLTVSELPSGSIISADPVDIRKRVLARIARSKESSVATSEGFSDVKTLTILASISGDYMYLVSFNEPYRLPMLWTVANIAMLLIDGNSELWPKAI